MAVRETKNKHGKVTSHRVVWREKGARDGVWQTVGGFGPTPKHKGQAERLDGWLREEHGYDMKADDPRIAERLDRVPAVAAEPEDAPTVGQLVADYIERPSIRESTRVRYRPTLKRLGDLAAMPVADLDRKRHINPWFRAFERDGYAPKTRALAKAVLSGALRDHADVRELFRDVRISNKARLVDPKVLTDDAVRDLIAHAGDSGLALMIRVAVETGLRKGELFGLVAEDVDLAAREINVRWQIADKSRGSRRHGFKRTWLKHESHRRTVPISTELADALALVDLLADDEPVFRQPSKQRGHGDMSWWLDAAHGKAWRKIRAATPSAPRSLRWHDLRHTAGMRWLRTPDIDIDLVSELLGHENVGITSANYVHWKADDAAKIRAAALRL